MASTSFGKTKSDIQQFYAGRSVLVTGATGFLGKVLVEKLLRCCPDIETVYLLLRPKKGMSPSERLNKLLEKECFDPLKEKYPAFKEKIELVVGDIVKPLCGIAQEDLTTLQGKVSMVFHSAARVQFFDPLRTVVEENVLGTKHALEICKELPLLEAFVHVSTAFTGRDIDCIVSEDVGDFHVKPKQIFDLFEIIDDKSLKMITSCIVKDTGTTYQFSKALAEQLVNEERGNMPTCIVRPCLVSPSWKEPLKGWCDIYQGISGLFVAAAKGFFRAAYADKEYRVLMVPADVVVNCMIASAWYLATKRQQNMFVVNCAMPYDDFPVGQELLKHALDLRVKFPMSTIYRYPDFTLHKKKWLWKLHATLDHYIPGQIIDVFLLCFTGKTLMMPLYRKVESLWNVYLKQGAAPWYFIQDNYNKVKNAMCAKDQEVFFLDMTTINWPEYIVDSALGGRKFLCKEGPETIPYALMKNQIWWLVTTILKWCLILYIMYCLIPQRFMDSATAKLENHIYAPKPVSDEL